MIYPALNQAVLERVPPDARRILDLGCGTGALGRALKAARSCTVVGVTCSAEEAQLASAGLDQVLLRDLNTFDFAGIGEFDGIICSHVLEHLLAPETVLARVRSHLSVYGRLVVALPNVMHWRQRLEFLRGRFAYTEHGLMDRSHYRHYDWQTAQALLVGGGYVIERAEAFGGCPLSRLGGPIRGLLDRLALRVFPGLFGWQFVFVCRGGGLPGCA